MTEPYVGIVLVNYRGAEDTIECIDSLNEMEYQNFFIVVVDNHSEDPVHQFILEGPLSLTVYHDGTSKNNQNENITLAFTVDDIEAAHQKVLALGAPIVEPPTQRPWGAVNMSFRDPDGNVVYLRSFPKNR